MSPGFPSDYSGSLDNTDTIHGPVGTVIKITFTDFRTESGYDKLSIKELDGTTLLNAHSGSSMPADLQSGGAGVKVIFKTDSALNYMGWRMEWTAITP
jgi:hypothetical protein